MIGKDDMFFDVYYYKHNKHVCVNKWRNSEYILNVGGLSREKQQVGGEEIFRKTFLIKIYKNGNVDIKEQYQNGTITDILIINDNIKFPEHIINIIRTLLLESHNYYWHYYNMVFDIIKNYKKDLTTQELIQTKDEFTKLEKELIKEKETILKLKEELYKEKEELDKLILYNKQQITHYESLEDKIISIEKDKKIILEEKHKIAIVKGIMAKNKLDFDNEKLKFEIEKDRINSFNIDTFLNSELI